MQRHEELLEMLQGSEVFALDFPKRLRLTHCEFAQLAEDDRPNDRAGILAIRRVPEFNWLVSVVRQLEAAKCEDAVPILGKIWKECALVPLRVAAGHALRGIGTLAARTALVDFIEDSDPFSAYLAVRAIFDSAPIDAYEKLIPYFEADRIKNPGGAVIPHQILSIFSPSSFSVKGPNWTEPSASQWLRDDPRWIKLCVELRRDDCLGGSARNVLRYIAPEVFEEAVEAAKGHECARVTKRRSRRFGDLVTRYNSGEYISVWQLIWEFDAIDGDFRMEVEAVARETMRRVAHNLDLLAARLEVRGWQPLMEDLRTMPNVGDVHVFSEIERITKGPVPTSLLAFWQIVGGVDLIWDYNTGESPPDLIPDLDLDLDILDPIAVISPSNIEWQFEEWEHAIEATHPELLDPFYLELAPDYLHKANVSGGGPYGVELPFFGADPVFAAESHGFHFVDYLRHCLKWGGFSRLERHANGTGVSQLIAILTAEFEPF